MKIKLKYLCWLYINMSSQFAIPPLIPGSAKLQTAEIDRSKIE